MPNSRPETDYQKRGIPDVSRAARNALKMRVVRGFNSRRLHHSTVQQHSKKPQKTRFPHGLRFFLLTVPELPLPTRQRQGYRAQGQYPPAWAVMGMAESLKWSNGLFPAALYRFKQGLKSHGLGHGQQFVVMEETSHQGNELRGKKQGVRVRLLP